MMGGIYNVLSSRQDSICVLEREHETLKRERWGDEMDRRVKALTSGGSHPSGEGREGEGRGMRRKGQTF